MAAVSLPGSVTTEDRVVDVETKGELTRGMLVVDTRNALGQTHAPHVFRLGAPQEAPPAPATAEAA